MDSRELVAPRLRAARIAAGYWTKEAAAEIVGVSYRRYSSAERRFPKDPEIAGKVVWFFGVSREYLLQGWTVSASDVFAHRVEELLVAFAVRGYVGDVALRLRQARMNQAIATASAAARDKGWPLSTYIQHENGTRAVPIELLVVYAVALQHRPEYLAFGAGGQREESDWVRSIDRRLRRQRDGGSSDIFSLQLYEELDGELSEATSPPLVGPSILFPILRQPESQHIGIIRRGSDGSANEVWVVRISGDLTGDDIVVCEGSRIIKMDGVRPGQFGGEFFEDAFTRPRAVGRHVGTIRLDRP